MSKRFAMRTMRATPFGWTHLLALAAGLIAVPPAANATPPHVLRVTPASGTTDLDPATADIIVTFDQPMADSSSVTNGLCNVPGDAGPYRWLDDHTFDMPVRLRPDRDYFVSLNAGDFRNFANIAGETLVPYPIRLSTSPVDTHPRAAADKHAFERLKRAMHDDYAHLDGGDIDWDARFAEYEPRLLAAPSVRVFGRVAAEMLAPAHDAHMGLWQRSISGWNYLPFPMPPPNVNADTLARVVPDWTAVGEAVETGRFSDGIGYIGINEWLGATSAALPAIYAAVKATDPARGLIIDTRANGGGSELLGQDVAGCFVRASTPYASVRLRQGGAWFGPYVNAVGPNPACTPFPAGRVAVLEGPDSMSADESFLKMMKLAGAAIIGETSLGSSGLPRNHPLGRGLVFKVPSMEDRWPDGTPVEGVGVTPTIEVKTGPDDFATTDPVLDAALAWLRAPR